MLNNMESFVLLPLTFKLTEKLNDRSNCFLNKNYQQSTLILQYFKLNTQIYRFLGNILIVDFTANFSYFLIIYYRLLIFLKKKFIQVDKNVTSIQILYPNMFFEYLGFKFTNMFNRKIQCTRYLNQENFFYRKILFNYYNNITITICSKTFSNLKEDLRNIFAPIQLKLPLNVLIQKYNQWLIKVIIYFGLSKTIVFQLKQFDFLSSCYFLNYLITKFGSKPQLRYYIYQNFFSKKGIVQCGNVKQLRIKDIEYRIRHIN